MKASILCCLMFLVVGLSSVLANEIISSTNFIPNYQLDNTSLDFEEDYPYAYAVRIKRFQHPNINFDYFSPIYTAAYQYEETAQLGTGIYNLPQYNEKAAKEWAERYGNFAIWKYYNDEYYRKSVDMWNSIYNSNWSFSISERNPLGGFNFTQRFGMGALDFPFNDTALSMWYYGFTYGDYSEGSLFGPNGYFSIGSPRFYGFQTGKVIEPVEQEIEGLVLVPIETVASFQNEVQPNFYKHVTLQHKKKMPKNWRSLSPGMRIWFQNKSIEPPTAELYKDNAPIIRYRHQRGPHKAILPNSNLYYSSPQFGGSEAIGIKQAPRIQNSGGIHN